MNRTLFEAILAMDAYNRGYDPGIELLETNIGSATLGIDSGELKDENDVRLDQGINFYAISYSYAGETIIAYRGTDSLVGDYFLDGDIWNGYGVGGGSIAGNQALMAFQFYQRVAGLDPATMTEVDLKSADISLVGHSMGGGLAGLVAAVYHKSSSVFNNMPFEEAAQNTDDILNTPVHYEIYGLNTPWAESFTFIQGWATDGEFLDALRIFEDYNETELSAGENSGLGALDLHSMSTHVILQYAYTLDNDWEKIGEYFWQSLYDNGFAQEMGATLGGAMAADHDYAGILRTALAYSAIDEGTRVFGDTGIRALFDDANQLGKVYTPSASTYLKDYIEDYSRILTQYAGAAALNQIVYQ